MTNTNMTTEQAIELLKKIVKPSTALDEFRHFDLSLVSVEERPRYQAAIKVVAHALKTKEITQDFFEKSVTFKD
ncbi:MAG: hypothetical protein QE271_12450 [Bacteriovoracaceae bacterium]|nr:hypothetical protein [Bacteriovoracaceae bacterium]